MLAAVKRRHHEPPLTRRRRRRYATSGTQVVVILLTTSLTQRGIGWLTGAVLPAVKRRLGTPYTQEQLHEMHMNAGFHLGNAFAEVALVTMQARPQPVTTSPPSPPGARGKRGGSLF